MQKDLKYVPKRKYIKYYVHILVKKARLKDDPRLRYFKLLAACALMGKESMYFNFKRRKRHVSKKESRSKKSNKKD